jgi:uncharacterized coiled-coil protein SlyX
MANEEVQRTMEFILGQQARFAANIQLLQEERIRDSPRLTRLEESFQLLVRVAESTDIRLDRLESNVSAQEVNMAALEANMAALVVAQTHTDERLSALIDIVREDRNGKS